MRYVTTSLCLIAILFLTCTCMSYQLFNTRTMVRLDNYPKEYLASVLQPSREYYVKLKNDHSVRIAVTEIDSINIKGILTTLPDGQQINYVQSLEALSKTVKDIYPVEDDQQISRKVTVSSYILIVSFMSILVSLSIPFVVP